MRNRLTSPYCSPKWLEGEGAKTAAGGVISMENHRPTCATWLLIKYTSLEVKAAMALRVEWVLVMGAPSSTSNKR